MKFSYLFAPLILLPLYAFSYPKDEHQSILLSEDQQQDTQALTYSNESINLNEIKNSNRSVHYPTQIIRMKSNIEDQQITCPDVHAEINKILVENIANNQFTYAMYISCHYDPETYLATDFTINSYFDPINDEAISFLKSYLSEYNDTALLGTKFHIESAKGMIISLSVAAGMKKNPLKPPFIEYRRDRSNFYFKSNYEMRNKLFTDISENFYTNNAAQLLPFLDRWMFINAGSVYKNILRDSNYIELQPERIFLMENGEEIFVTGLKQYFMHHCDSYDNHRCLKPT
jgi:hypothetical protein